jgi:hypothetical protein
MLERLPGPSLPPNQTNPCHPATLSTALLLLLLLHADLSLCAATL